MYCVVHLATTILARSEALGGTMTEFEFLEVGFPFFCIQKVLDENYIKLSERIEGSESNMLSVHSRLILNTRKIQLIMYQMERLNLMIAMSN